MRQKASEAAATVASNRDELNAYIDTWHNLRDQLDSGELSDEETFTTKQQILDIQNQIVEKYGDQAAGIDLVNGKLEEQLSILGDISANDANTLINENWDTYQKAIRAVVVFRQVLWRTLCGFKL